MIDWKKLVLNLLHSAGPKMVLMIGKDFISVDVVYRHVFDYFPDPKCVKKLTQLNRQNK